MFESIEIVRVNQHRHDVRLTLMENGGDDVFHYDLSPKEIDELILRLQQAVKLARASSDKAETPL